MKVKRIVKGILDGIQKWSITWMALLPKKTLFAKEDVKKTLAFLDPNAFALQWRIPGT
jgi:hypothetical protein